MFFQIEKYLMIGNGKKKNNKYKLLGKENVLERIYCSFD